MTRTEGKADRRILIVDDNQAIHDDFRKILCPEANRRTGIEAGEAALFGDSEAPQSGPAFELDFATQGQEALQMVSRALTEGRPYMLAFVDVRMPPGWDGIETTARIWEVDRHLQVAICTAYSDYSWKEVATRLSQPDRFVILKKPFDVVEVLQLANAFSEKWRLVRQVEEDMRQLQERENLYHFLADAMPGIVWTAKPDGKINYANQRMQEFSGRTLDQNRDWGWQEVLHPDDVPRTMERWTRSFQTGADYEIEYRLKRFGDGAYRWHLGRAVPMRNEKGEIVHWVGTSVDIEDQKRAEGVLRQAQADLEVRVGERTAELGETRARLEHLVRSSPAILYCVKPGAQSQITFISDNVSRVLGYEPAAFTGNPNFWMERVHPEDAAEVARHYAQLLATGDHPVDYRFRHTDGSYRWMHEDARMIRDPHGNPVEIVGAWTDVTERRGMEEALRKSEKRYRELIEAQGEGVATLDSDLCFTFANPAAERIFGVWSGKLVGRKLAEFLSEKDKPILQKQSELRKAGEKSTYEIEIVAGNGERRQVAVTGMPQFDGDGKFSGSFAVYRDVTERRKAEGALRQSEERIRMLVSSVTDYSIVMLDAEGRIASWNSGAEKIKGYAAHEIIGKHFSVSYPPEDLERGKPGQELKVAETEGRLETEGWRLRKDGARFWASVSISAVRDSSGGLRGFSEVTRDITERKRADGVLRLQTSALKAAANGIVITDRTGHILWVNPAFTRLTGYAMADAIGKTPAVLKSGAHDKSFYEAMWSTILAGKVWQGEIVNRRKDGSQYYEEMTITPVLSERGEIQNFVAVKQDISQRKHFEQVLGREHDLLRTLLDNSPDRIYFKDLQSRFVRVSKSKALRTLQHAAPALRERLERLRRGDNGQSPVLDIDLLRGLSDFDLYTEEHAQKAFDDEQQIIRTGQPVLGKMEKQVDQDGAIIWSLTDKLPWRDKAGNIIGTFGISKDMTAFKGTEANPGAEEGLFPKSVSPESVCQQ
jgi:PAS domain S-box-containing protein